MQMVKVRFLNADDRERVVDLAKRTSVVALRGGFFVIPSEALDIFDQWQCAYEVVERGGYDALVVRPLRGAAAGSL
ncbi:MAG TPA: hypothetical protein VFJ58_14080 [Armatimonadota bacterium]|nr:hypothetical protein [Armatimonadota bacterium]